jgi:hypothetical protein
MIRRVKIEPIMSAAFLKVGVLAQHGAAQPVRLKAVASPNPRNGHVIGAQLGRQVTAAPLGGSILRVTTGPLPAMERWLFSFVEERIPFVGLFVETLLAEKKTVSGALPTAFAPTTKGTEVMFDIRSLGRKWKSAATPASRECRLTVSVVSGSPAAPRSRSLFGKG